MQSERLKWNENSGPLPYLDDNVIEEFANLCIKSTDGSQIRLNSLFLISWSRLARKLLKDALIQNEEVTISSDHSYFELQMVHSFVMKGILPSPEADIVAGKIDQEINNLFLDFGIDLRFILTSSSIKMENNDTLNEFQTYLQTKLEVETDSEASDFENIEENFQKKSTKKKKSRKFDPVADLADVDFDLEALANFYEPKTIMDYEEDSDPDYEPLTKKVKKEFDQYSPTLPSNSDATSNRKSRGRPRKNLEELAASSIKKEKVPYLQKIRGLMKKVGDRYWYTSHKLMLEYQVKYRDTFYINIPPSDFTEEDFNTFVFPKPLEDMEVVPRILSNEGPAPGTNKCNVCDEEVPNPTALKDHFVKAHSVHYVCPYDSSKCNYAFQKTGDQSDLYKLARHIYYHDHKPLQYLYPHECLACGYKTPFTCNIQSHLKTQGPYHDNRCPNCPERFYTRADLLHHMKVTNHEGYMCGLCEEVFETSLLKNRHRRTVHGKCQPPQPKSTVCDLCGKVFPRASGLYQHKQIVHAPSGAWPCDQCDKVLKSKDSLRSHVKNSHSKTPCTICGKMFTKTRMIQHINAVHTEEHLKPFSCGMCSKGFATQERLRNHMNIHTGNKPHVCKYCGRGFADKANMRMHEKTTHEGYKRPMKGKAAVGANLTENNPASAFGSIS